MSKFLIIIFLSYNCLGQKLHHQMLSSQGKNVKLSNNLVVLQSIGQSSVVGTSKSNKLVIGQGYIQSFGILKNTSLAKEDAMSVIVYPNPVIDEANFKFSASIFTPVTFYFFDERGRLIFKGEQTPLQNTITVDLTSLAEGVYFAKLETPHYMFSTKILKTK